MESKPMTQLNTSEGSSYMLEKVVYYALLVAIFLMPSVPAVFVELTIRPEELLLPVVALILLKNRDLNKNSYLLFLMLFAAYIFLTIVVNGRFFKVRDYFEIYKLAKYGILFMYFFRYTKLVDFRHSVRLVLGGLLVFNLAQYFNIFYFNEYIEPLYAKAIHLRSFGVNSIGMPAVKRMLGTMGNPNNNALMFLFFAIFFAPIPKQSRLDTVLFLLSFLAILACQSRTGMIAFMVVMFVHFIVQAIRRMAKWRYVTKYAVGLVLVFFCFSTVDNLWIERGIEQTENMTEAQIIELQEQQAAESGVDVNSNDYIMSLVEQDMSQTTSVKGRLEVWKHLWGMVKKKPIFGHGPYKEYFYDNNLYSESEYMLVIWRYGFIGLLFYLVWIALPLIRSFKHYDYVSHKYLWLYSIVIMLAAITNNPFSEPRILAIYALLIGHFFFLLSKTPEVDEKTLADR